MKTRGLDLAAAIFIKLLVIIWVSDMPLMLAIQGANSFLFSLSFGLITGSGTVLSASLAHGLIDPEQVIPSLF